MKNLSGHAAPVPGAFAPSPAMRSSGGLGWPGVLVEEGSQEAHNWRVPAFSEHIVMLVLGHGAGRVRREVGGEVWDTFPRTGALSLVPAGAEGHCHCEARIESLSVRLDPGFVARVAEENFGSARFHLLARVGAEDEAVRQVALLLRAEARSENQGGALMAQSLAHALAVSLLRRHAHFHAPHAAACELCGGLSARALGRVEELVRENLACDLSLDDMAGAAGTSRFHFARLFKASTGQAPYQYVLGRRVERARHLIGQGRLPLREVALASGFSDQSHMTRHFRRLTGTTPRAFQVLARGKCEQEPSKNRS